MRKSLYDSKRQKFALLNMSTRLANGETDNLNVIFNAGNHSRRITMYNLQSNTLREQSVEIHISGNY